jgi:hypothetical protein
MKRKFKVLKARGGKDASKADFKTPSATAKGPPSKGFNDNPPPSKIKTTGSKDVPFVKPLNMGQSLAAGLIIPFSGTAINLAAKLQYKDRQRFARKKGLYRDQYKTTGNVLQPNSPTGKQYLKDAGYGANKPVVPTDDGRGGEELIPLTAKKPVDQLLVKPKDNFFNFVAYNSGGISSGPPPKKGPNPQVPPVKMKKGKMNSMTCPHRPDGIRGMGAAIKGSKFIGVK